MKMRDQKVFMLAYGGMMAALVFVATYFLRLPLFVIRGYIHLGDGFILLGAATLGWVAVPAAAIGSMLADLLAGYTIYCLPTLVIKAAVAALAVWAAMDRRPYWQTVALYALSELVMVCGYFVTEWLFLGYGLAAAFGEVFANAVQGLSGVLIGAALTPAMRRARKEMQR